jgi:PAS domain S-box-containing protein
VLIIAALNLFVIALTTVGLRRSLDESRQDALTVVDNLAQVLQASLTGTIRHADLALLTVADEYRRQSRAGGINDKLLNELMARQLAHLPEIESLRALDADGFVRYGVGANSRTNLSDREHFIAARDDATVRLLVAKPVFARIAKKWVIVFARRLETADGGFAGVVYINVALDRLSRDFLALHIGTSGTASLLDASLAAIVRVPEPLPSEQAAGRGSAAPQLEELAKAGKSRGTFMTLGDRDRVERAVAFRRLDPYPMFVTIGLAESDYLSFWRQEAQAAMAAVALFALVTLTSAWLLMRAWRAQHATAAALAKSELELKTIIDTEPECVKLLDPDCRLLRMNAAGLRMIDADSIGAVLGQDVTALIAPPYREAFRALTRRVFDGESDRLEFEAISLKGRHIWLDTHATPLRDATGNIVGALGVTRDISERKRSDEMVHRLKDELEQRVAERTAQLEAANRELEEFSYSMSHDMRTPLRAINGYSAILLEEHAGQLDEEGRRLLMVLGQNAERMGHLIDDIVRFVGMARRTMRPAVLDMNVLTREVFERLQDSLPDRRMRLLMEWLPPVRGDADMVRQLLRELLSNAVKFSPSAAEAVIEVGGVEEGGECRYYVRDFGVGFDMRYSEKLFKVFERLHPTGQFVGTSIGLAIVKRIADRHGGRVWAEGAVDGGATFHFSLPASATLERGDPKTAPAASA